MVVAGRWLQLFLSLKVALDFARSPMLLDGSFDLEFISSLTNILRVDKIKEFGDDEGETAVGLGESDGGCGGGGGGGGGCRWSWSWSLVASEKLAA